MNRSYVLSFGIVALGLVGLMLLNISRFDWNASALLHVSREFGEAYSVPEGTVLYEDGGYDGMLYMQIARDIPEIFLGAPTYDHAYRWQRILLPALASLLSMGNDSALPFVILGVNVASVLGALFLFLALAGKPNIHAFTLVGNPAALVGILFSLTEPLALFFTMLFLFFWKKSGERVTWGGAPALALALLARETTVLLTIPLLFLPFQYSAEYWNKRFRNIFLLCLSFLPFALWMLFLTNHFDTFPWETNEGMLALPFSGILSLLQHTAASPNAYVLSSAAFFLLFFLPLIAALVSECLRAPQRGAPTTMILGTILAFFLFLDAHIWNVLTSVGRVIPALYPIYALWALEHDSRKTRSLSAALILVSTTVAIGIALSPHPFTIAP